MNEHSTIFNVELSCDGCCKSVTSMLSKVEGKF